MENTIYDSPKKALLVIDIQEDYTGTAAKSPFPYKDSEKLIGTVNQLIEKAPDNNMMVIYIRQVFEGFSGKVFSKLLGHGTALKASPGSEFDKRLNIKSNHCFTKSMPDAFSNPKLQMLLKEHQINELYLTGLDAAGCVFFTAKGALKHGYRVNVIADSIVMLKEEKRDSLLGKFKQRGITLITSAQFT